MIDFKAVIKRKLFAGIFSLSLFCFSNLYSETYSKSQLIPSDHWIYDALFTLYSENGKCSIADMAPLSVNEISLYFSDIDYEKLSFSGRILYDKVSDFLSEKKFTFDFEPVSVGFNVMLYPELMYKSNDDIDWSFATDYTNLSGEENGYGAASSFSGNAFTKPFITLPIYIDFADLFIIETDASISKNFWGFSRDSNFTNIFWSGDDFEFAWPLSANASAGYLFKNGLGVNLNVARSNMRIGKTKTGSIIYNDTFQTDFFVDLSLYAKRLKYAMNVVQVSTEKYIYLHTLELTPFKWLKAGITEATLVKQPFELRFLNPLMIMHSFGAWDEFVSGTEEDIYGEGYVGQYMGINVEVVPFKNLRFYFNYAQTESQPPSELGSATGRAIPDGYGMQAGFDITIADNKHGGFYIGNIEGIYTTPYLYVKQGSSWSFYRDSYCMQNNGSIPYNSWIGTPFGPDSLGVQVSLTYDKPGTFKINGSYLFLAHGENTFDMFNKKVLIDGVEYYAYYPSVRYKMGVYKNENPTADFSDESVILSAEESEKIARSHNLSGVIQYTNQIKLSGTYIVNPHLKFDAQAIYNLVINNQHIKNKIAYGFEMELGVELKLF